MARNSRWPRLEADGAVWEARVVPGSDHGEPSVADRKEVVEFHCVSGGRKSRRLSIPAGRLRDLDEAALGRIYRQARPTGGEHSDSRPGRPVTDAP